VILIILIESECGIFLGVYPVAAKSSSTREPELERTSQESEQESVLNKTKDEKFRLSQKVVDYILENIIKGVYQPGQKISPKDIASRLNVSSSPVRDAMEQLERDGWIERFPQSGTYLKQISLRNIEEIYELRNMLETGAVELAIQRITTQQLAELKDVVDELNRAAQSNLVDAYEKADTDFHQKLVAATANESVINVFDLVLRKTRCYFIALKATKHDLRTITNLEQTPVSHTQLYQAIVDKNTALAKTIIRNHIDISCEWNKATAKVRWLSNIK
jgi:DNA-binding GntR family transcriptional regulator